MATEATGAFSDSDKPMILKAIELIIANPADLKRQVEQHFEKYEEKYGQTKSRAEIREMIADKVIRHYSNLAAASGGATALSSVIPGLGTAVAMVGGASADIVVCMKFQIEMVMELATVYGHDITREEGKNLCFVVAGVGALNQAAVEGGKKAAGEAAQRMIREYLKGSALVAVKEIFKKVGVVFARKSLEKAAPLGIGVVLSAGANKVLTVFVGNQTRDYFRAN